jgi:hypothetical protein
MKQRTFTYEGFDGKMHTDTWNFYLSKADLLEINVESFVGLDALMKRLFDTQNGKEIMAIIREIILRSVGRPSQDGRRFIRNEELRQEFYQTEAYAQLLTEMFENPDKLNEFIISIVPHDMAVGIQQAMAQDAKQQSNETAPPVAAAEA